MSDTDKIVQQQALLSTQLNRDANPKHIRARRMAGRGMPLALLVMLALLAGCQPFSPEASGLATPGPPPTAHPATAPPAPPSASVVAPSATLAPSAIPVPPTPTAIASAVPSPTATPTQLLPTATATPQPAGTISGRLGYPSEGIPPLDIYAVRVDDPGRFYLLKTALNQTTFSWSGIAPGHYYILAYLSEQPEATLSGSFSEFSTCGLLASCPSHSLIPVPVRAGETGGVQVTDWYAPPGTFLQRPPGTPITTTIPTGPVAIDTAVTLPTAPPTLPPPPSPTVDAPTLPIPNTANMTPEEVIVALYDAINRRDYTYAYALWANSGAASGQSYAEFVAGYATTDEVTIDTKPGWIQGAAGSSYGCVPIVLLSVENDGTVHSFAGHYRLRRSNVVPGGDPNWRIDQSKIQLLDHIVYPGSQESNELLDANNCP